MLRYLRLALLLSCLTPCVVRAGEEIKFNRDIRPILAENCFACHGQDENKREADLRLDRARDAYDSGAIIPGDAEGSELIARILDDDPEWVMPPPDANRKLTNDQRQLLARWINQGAEYEDHWAFVAPTRPAEPTVRDESWVRNPIDRFVLSKLEAKDWSPSPPADRTTLIKRLYIDLIGLPPTPQEVDQFVSDTDPNAYANLVNRLLRSPHYGERMALPWLDAARYADSNGFQQDGDTWQWIWRDWVVRSFNEDLPFDQFTTWQLAGDLLPDASIDQKIASGFNRNHLLNGEGGAIAEEQRFVILFDRMDTTATTWLGLTMACAQCHDHKYDPITMGDYYRLLDGFNRVPETGTPQRQSARIRVARPFIELPTEENLARIAEFEQRIGEQQETLTAQRNAAFEGWRAAVLASPQSAIWDSLGDEWKAIQAKPAESRSDEEKSTWAGLLRGYFDEHVRPGLDAKFPSHGQLNALRSQLQSYRGDQIPRVMVMSDDQPRQTHILSRGQYLQPLEEVSFGTPEFLPPLPEGAPANRLGLAQWLMSESHPLTARVQVNRMWQHFFGIGIVKTSEDFGVQSEYPVHGDLLDWLAVEFRENGWSMKEMHRLIVMSATYRQSSRVSKHHLNHDAENRYFSRASRFRMPSMLLRDWALASSGLLETSIGGKPVYPYQPDNVWEPLAITKERDFTYPASSGTDLYRRSLYTFWRRTVMPSNMFDTSNRQACRVRSTTTSTPLHALTTLNDPTWVEAARVLAELCLQTESKVADQLTLAFRRVACRPPTDTDLQRLLRAYEKQLDIYRNDTSAADALLSVGEAPRDESTDPATHAALTAVCLAILNLDESLSRE